MENIEILEKRKRMPKDSVVDDDISKSTGHLGIVEDCQGTTRFLYVAGRRTAAVSKRNARFLDHKSFTEVYPKLKED